MKAPAGGWWRLLDCCHCHKHCSKTTHTHIPVCTFVLHSFFSACGYEWFIDACVYPRSHHWRAVLLGQVLCEEREQWSVQTAKTLCQRLLQDTHTALDKVCKNTHTLHRVSSNDATHELIFLFLTWCVFRSPTSSSSVTRQSGSSSMWSSHCGRRRGASWEAVLRPWKTRWDNQMNCCHANLMLTPWADMFGALPCRLLQ